LVARLVAMTVLESVEKMAGNSVAQWEGLLAAMMAAVKGISMELYTAERWDGVKVDLTVAYSEPLKAV